MLIANTPTCRPDDALKVTADHCRLFNAPVHFGQPYSRAWQASTKLSFSAPFGIPGSGQKTQPPFFCVEGAADLINLIYPLINRPCAVLEIMSGPTQAYFYYCQSAINRNASDFLNSDSPLNDGGLGAGCSNIVPVIFATAGRQKRMPQKAVIPAIITMGYAGILIGPAFIGMIAHMSSLSVALGSLIFLLLFVSGAARFVRP